MIALVGLAGCSIPSEEATPVNTVSGEMRALFSVLTSEVTPDLWALYGSEVVIMALTDPTDLSTSVGSTMLDGPGAFTLDLQPTEGPVWLAAVLDDGDGVLTTGDFLWEYAGNPITTVRDDVLLDIDLPLMGGENEDEEPPEFTLRAAWDAAVPARLVVTTVWNDTAVTLGTQDVAPGDAVAIELPDGPELSLVAIHDTNGDGLYGGADRGGLVTTFTPPMSDSIDLGAIALPDGTAAPTMQPDPWVTISGTATSTEGPITIEARRFTATGRLWSRQVLEESGAFAVRVPRSSTAGPAGRDQDRQLWLHAFVDDDGDATIDLADELQAAAGPITVDGPLEVPLDLGPPAPRLWGGISGEIDWDGTPAGEHVVVAVFLEDASWAGLCEYVRVYSDPVFPLEYSFPNLPGDRYQVGAFLTPPESIIDPMAATALGMDDEVVALEAGVDLRADFDLVTGAVPPVENGGG